MYVSYIIEGWGYQKAKIITHASNIAIFIICTHTPSNKWVVTTLSIILQCIIWLIITIITKINFTNYHCVIKSTNINNQLYSICTIMLR